MYGLNFIKTYGGRRVEGGSEIDPFLNESLDEESEDAPERLVLLGIETCAEQWQPISPQLPARWRVNDWTSRPVRFIDGKDAGRTVATLRGTGGHWLPVRLAEIGSVEMRLVDGELRRRFVTVERVVSLVTSVYPWEEIESLALALQENSLRLLPVRPQEENRLSDFGRMQQATIDRTTAEMLALEEVAIAQDADTPTIVDGLLAKHDGGFDQERSPVFGVVKNHRQTHLHTLGQQILYQLAAAFFAALCRRLDSQTSSDGAL